MDHSAPEGLIEHFSKLEDPRVDRNKKHELIDVIVLCVSAVLSGAEGWCDIEEFGRTKLDWLRRYVPLANGIPVDDTIARIISALSVSGFQECFLSWMEDVVKLSDGEIIALDGKTHRRSHDRKRGVKALHMVSAWACRNGVVLGQVKTEEKSNEIVAVPQLLEKLELKGCIVTLDAMGCQRAIAKQLRPRAWGRRPSSSYVSYNDCHRYTDERAPRTRWATSVTSPCVSHKCTTANARRA